MAFATRVEVAEKKKIDPESLYLLKVGINRRLRKERDRLKQVSDPEYKARRMANIQKLKIIKEEIMLLNEQL